MRLRKKIESAWARIAPSLKLNTDVSKSWPAEEALKGNSLSEKLFVTFSHSKCRREQRENAQRNHLPEFIFTPHFLPEHTHLHSPEYISLCAVSWAF